MSWEDKHLNRLDDERQRSEQDATTPPARSVDEDADMQELRRDVRLIQAATRLDRMQKEFTLLRKLNKDLPEVKTPRNLSTQRLLSLITAAAALVLLFIWSPWNAPDNSEHGQYYAYLVEHFDAYLIHADQPKSSDPAVDRLKTQAFNFFSLQEFERAQTLLEEVVSIDEDRTALFYLIVSQYALGNTEAAQTLYNEKRNSLTAEQVALIDDLVSKAYK